MTPAIWLIAGVAFLLVVALVTMLVDRWSRRRRIVPRLREIGRRETGDDCLQFDILKRGDVLPFRRDY